MKKTEIDILKRKNKGNLIRPQWIESLENTCGFHPAVDDFLSLKETERLKEAFYDKIKNGTSIFRENCAKDDFDKIIHLLHDKCIDIYALPVILFSDIDQYIGAVQLPCKYVLTNIENIWKLVKEDIAITTLDVKNGLCLELNFYSINGDYVKEGIYELTTWGFFSCALVK